MSSALTVPLGKVAEINPTFKSATISPDEFVDFLPMAAVDEGNSVALATEHRPLSDVQKGYTNFNDGDVLLAKITPCFENGKIAQVRLKYRYGFGSTEFHVVRPHSEKLDARYLVHFLRRDEIRVDGARKMTGSAGQRRVPKHYLESLPIYLPPLPEQRRIAAILDQADALRAKRREALAELDQLTQSIFIEMFGSALNAPARTAMGALMEEFRYGTSEKSSSNGYPTLRIPNVASGSLDLTELKTVPVEPAEFQRLRLLAGDLLFVRTNGNPDNVGRCAVFDPTLVEKTGYDTNQFIYASYLIRARLKKSTINPVVLQHYLSSGEGRRALRARCKTSAGQYNINTESLAAIPVPVLPPLLQEGFAERIEALESLKINHRASVAELNSLFSSLQHRAFRGEL